MLYVHQRNYISQANIVIFVMCLSEKLVDRSFINFFNMSQEKISSNEVLFGLQNVVIATTLQKRCYLDCSTIFHWPYIIKMSSKYAICWITQICSILEVLLYSVLQLGWKGLVGTSSFIKVHSTNRIIYILLLAQITHSKGVSNIFISLYESLIQYHVRVQL